MIAARQCRNWILIVLSMLGVQAQAEIALPRRCLGENAHAIQRGDFTYRYTISEGEDASVPTLIFIPGGPGQTSTDAPLASPSGMPVIRTDPRGVGCNQSDALTDADLTSGEIAKDILAIVRERHLTNYVLHGISFGTVVATMAAALAPQEGLPLPKAVVLEGIIGRAFAPGEYDKTYIERWNKLRTQIPDRLRTELLQNRMPIDLSSQEIANWIAAITNFGEVPMGGDYGLFQLQRLDKLHENPDDSDNLRRQIKNMTTPPSPERLRLKKQITCHEIANDMRDAVLDFDIKDGELVANDSRMCDGHKLDRPFDSGHYQIRAPIFYFSGSEDPATPPYQARYHFDHQKSSSQKTLVTVEGGGHGALSNTLGDCQNPLWNAILGGDEGELHSALQSCTLGPQTKVYRFK